MSSEYGVINEQGFAAGYGLGFNPFDESELKNEQNTEKDDHNSKE